MGDDDAKFVREVGARAARKVAAQRAGTQPVWVGLGMIGVIGWSVVVPTLLGAVLGAWIDRHRIGTHSWTLALLLVGLLLGCANAWNWISRQSAVIEKPLVDRRAGRRP